MSKDITGVKNLNELGDNQNDAKLSNEEHKEVEDFEKKSVITKQERIKKERDSLLSKLAANNLNNIRSKVAFILNHYPETRNSDINLAFEYWKIFQPEHLLSDGNINQMKMFKLERIPSLVRARAKIQNEYGLFGADEEVRQKRRTLEYKVKEEQLTDKPGIPSITFYIDESGKTQEYVIVGGMCTVDAFQAFRLNNHLTKWVHDKKYNHEFHFTELSKNRLNAYKEFFIEALGFSDFIGFKAVVVTQNGIKNRTIDEIVAELHYQLIHKSMEHEVSTKRISLPRNVNVYKDKEDGSDGILMTKLEQELKAGFLKHFGEKLNLAILEAVDSKSNFFIQLADLYIGSISRVLNRDKNANRNHKDEFADFVIETLELSINDEFFSNQDLAFVCFLK